MIELPESRLVKKALNVAVEHNDISTLIKSLKMTLNEIDKRIDSDWKNLNHIPKRELQNQRYDRKWLRELSESAKGNKGNSKLRTYKEFKQDVKIESYLTYISVRAHRIALAKLRTSSHQFRIETGRYQKLEEADRKCLLCNSGEVESEIHFVTQCLFFEKKREKRFIL